MTSTCPECGAPVAERAAVCPRCGFPLRRDAIPPAPPPGGYGPPPPQGHGPPHGYAGAPPASGPNVKAIFIALGVVALLGIALIGVLAAIAIPKFTQVARQARAQQASLLLRQVYVLEQTYYATNGRFAAQLDSLRSVGWDDPPAGGDYRVRIASAVPDHLCIEALPKDPASDLPVRSMDGEGREYASRGCTGAPRDGYAGETEAVGGAGGDEGARRLMAEVYAGIVTYRAKSGRDPILLTDVLEHVHDSRASREFVLSGMNGSAGFCVVAEPRDPRSTASSWAVDARGRLFRGPACRGTPVEDLSHPAADSTSAGADTTD